MHEWSLVSSLLKQVEDLAAEHDCGRVLSVRVRVGDFSGIEADLLASAYEQLCGETRLAGSTLEIERVPLGAKCEDCGAEFTLERFQFECPQCASLNLKLTSGEELLLESVTMETR